MVLVIPNRTKPSLELRSEYPIKRVLLNSGFKRVGKNLFCLDRIDRVLYCNLLEFLADEPEEWRPLLQLCGSGISATSQVRF